MKELFSRDYTARHLMNPARPYVRAISTDVAETFRRIRAEMAAAKPAKVAHIKRSQKRNSSAIYSRTGKSDSG